MSVLTLSSDTSVAATLDRHITPVPPAPGNPDPGLLEVPATVPDPRDPRGLRYPMALLLAIAILATAAGMRGFAGYATWARTAPPQLLAGLGLTKRYRPSDKTFRRVFALIDPAELDRRLGGYFTALAVTAATDGELIAVAIDGKTLRLAKRMGAAAAHLVSAFTHRTHLVIGQLSVDDKTNEIPTVRALLKILRNALRTAGVKTKLLITIDAMHTQTATARLIRKTLGRHYLMIVKDNQAGAFARLTALPWHLTPVTATDSDDRPRHGRIETRNIQILTAASEIDFPHARQAIRIVRERVIVSTTSGTGPSTRTAAPPAPQAPVISSRRSATPR